MELDKFFLELGLDSFSRTLNDYLGANSPTNYHREILKGLFDEFPQFRIKTKIYRASRTGKSHSRELRNKFVAGCRCLKDVKSFIEKRQDKGYDYILESREEIDCFDLHAFIKTINEKYGNRITERYQDEKEIIFQFKFPYDWLIVRKV